jgi:hypothetical protein
VEKYTEEELIECLNDLYERVEGEWSGVIDEKLVEYRLKVDAIILIIKEK